MSSCRKPEIQNDLPKITKVKLICYFFNRIAINNPSLCFVIIFNNYLIAFYNIPKLKKIKKKPWVGLKPVITRITRLRSHLNICTIQCAKKSAENALNMTFYETSLGNVINWAFGDFYFHFWNKFHECIHHYYKCELMFILWQLI